jgi:hypothetical protein
LTRPALPAALLAAAPIFALALLPAAVVATPDLAAPAPPGHPVESCAECHFDGPPRVDSPAISLVDPAGHYAAGKTHVLTVHLALAEGETGGFLAALWREDGAAGTLAAGEGTAARGEAVISAPPVRAATADGLRWSFAWTSPEAPGTVHLQLAANAGNGDQSPLGDRLHAQTIPLAVR